MALAGDRLSQPVEGAVHPTAPTIQYVRVNHRRPDVLVAQELLYGPDVVTVLQKMGGKGMRKVWVVTCLASPACAAGNAG